MLCAIPSNINFCCESRSAYQCLAQRSLQKSASLIAAANLSESMYVRKNTSIVSSENVGLRVVWTRCGYRFLLRSVLSNWIGLSSARGACGVMRTDTKNFRSFSLKINKFGRAKCTPSGMTSGNPCSRNHSRAKSKQSYMESTAICAVSQDTRRIADG